MTTQYPTDTGATVRHTTQGDNKYQRTIAGATADVYDVLVAFNVTHPAIAHAIKKLLMPGQRGGKSEAQDVAEAIAALQRWEAMQRPPQGATARVPMPTQAWLDRAERELTGGATHG